MIPEKNSLWARYRQKGILVDTNILLLWFVGAVNRDRISQFKRTKQFSHEDYDLLIGFLAKFSPIVTTPNILTEVNSLVNQLGGNERIQCLNQFVRLVDEMTEIYRESRRITKLEKFSNYGLTDSGIIDVAANNYLVLTDDFKLSNFLLESGIDVINFNHLRSHL